MSKVAELMNMNKVARVIEDGFLIPRAIPRNINVFPPRLDGQRLGGKELGQISWLRSF